LSGDSLAGLRGTAILPLSRPYEFGTCADSLPPDQSLARLIRVSAATARATGVFLDTLLGSAHA